VRFSLLAFPGFWPAGGDETRGELAFVNRVVLASLAPFAFVEVCFGRTCFHMLTTGGVPAPISVLKPIRFALQASGRALGGLYNKIEFFDVVENFDCHIRLPQGFLHYNLSFLKAF
jgi:hypothetical protein